MTLGERIQNMRKEMGLSQEELAEKIGVSRQSVSKWENDAALPDTDRVIDLARLFGVSTDALLTGGDTCAETPPEAADAPDEKNDAAAAKEEETGKKPKKKPAFYKILAAVLAVAVLGLAAGIALIVSGGRTNPAAPEEPAPGTESLDPLAADL